MSSLIVVIIHPFARLLYFGTPVIGISGIIFVLITLSCLLATFRAPFIKTSAIAPLALFGVVGVVPKRIFFVKFMEALAPTVAAISNPHGLTAIWTVVLGILPFGN
jgi:hypothetical protein